MERIHPEGLCCPVCGCDCIVNWPELDNWDEMDDKTKSQYETCAACGFNVNREDINDV